MDMDDYQRVQKKLDLNETLVWVGRPRGSCAFTKQTVGAMLFGIPWCAIVSVVGSAFMYQFWFSDPSTEVTINDVKTTVSEVSIWLKLGMTAFFVPFVVIGLSTLLAPLWHKLWTGRLIYAVTTKRAMRLGPLFVKSWRPHDMFELDRIDKRNGSTDLLFAYSSMQTNGRSHAVGFTHLATTTASAAEKALRDLYKDED